MRVTVKKAPALEPGGPPRVCVEMMMEEPEARQFHLPNSRRDAALEEALEEHLSGHRHRATRQVNPGRS